MNGLKKFHKDERGLEALQVIMIVAIAAIILVLIKFAWPTIKKWFTENVNLILGFNDGNTTLNDGQIGSF